MTRITGAGLVGAGRIADVHAAAIRAAGAELRGVVSSTPARSAEAAERLSAERSFDSVAALAADPAIDVVHIASPTGLHAAQVAQVIAAGKHVVCEKPLATTVAEAAGLADAARRAGVVGTVAFTYRFHPVVLEARARVREGDLGRLLTVRGRYLQDWLLSAGPDEWRLDSARGGPSRAWADIGSHLVDLVEFISGERIERVASTAAKLVRSSSTTSVSGDDAVVASMTTATGTIGSLLVSQVAPGHVNALAVEISGELGALGVDLERTESLWLGAPGASSRAAGADLSEASSRAGFSPVGGTVDTVSGFLAFVRESYSVMAGNTSDIVGLLEDGVRSLKVGESVLLSTDERRWADVSD